MRLRLNNRADRVLLVSLLAFAVVASLITMMTARPAREGSIWRQPSTFFNDRYGTKASYLVLKRLGYSVTQIRRPIDADTLGCVSLLFSLEPLEPFQKYEEQALLNWVVEGHTLVVSPGHTNQPLRDGATALDSWFQVRESDAHQGRDQPVAGVIAQRGRELHSDAPLLDGVTTLTAMPGRRFEPGNVVTGPLSGADVEEIWIDEHGTVAAVVRHGTGRIVALADASPLSNESLGSADHAILLSNLARLAGASGERTEIAFDEFHLGFEEHDAPWTAIAALVWSGPWTSSILQATLVGILALYGAGVRFGKPIDLRPTIRRHHGEFARAAGRLLHDAGAANIAYDTLWRHYRSLLCRRMHLDSAVTDDALAKMVATSTGIDIVSICEASSLIRPGRRRTRAEVAFMARKLNEALQVSQHGT